MNCGEDGCPCCREESPTVLALQRWIVQQALVNERLAMLLERRRFMIVDLTPIYAEEHKKDES